MSIIEFKVDEEGKAIQQIKDKNYAEKYLYLKRDFWTIFLVGISFDSKIKNISEFDWEKI